MTARVTLVSYRQITIKPHHDVTGINYGFFFGPPSPWVLITLHVTAFKKWLFISDITCIICVISNNWHQCSSSDHICKLKVHLFASRNMVRHRLTNVLVKKKYAKTLLKMLNSYYLNKIHPFISFECKGINYCRVKMYIKLLPSERYGI